MDNTWEFDIQKDLDIIAEFSILPEILDIIRERFKMGFAAVTRITDQQWIVAQTRNDLQVKIQTGDRLPLSHTICSEIKSERKPIFIKCTDDILRYSSHPLNKKHGCKSYIAVPIFRDHNNLFGTLVVMDTSPVSLSKNEVLPLLKKFSRYISTHINLKDKTQTLNRELIEERRMAELRDTFIAVLGHDLRNPVGTTRMISDILLNQSLPEPVTKQLELIKSSSYRMQELINTILDLAKGHIADGIRLKMVWDKNQLLNNLLQVIMEAKSLDPSRKIKYNFEINKSFPCDPDRLGQLLSNLLSNALKHGNREDPIVVYAGLKHHYFEILVSNGGDKIPDNVIKNLFKPYYKENSYKNQQGLGLGLYIVSEIAKAHFGSVQVTSDRFNTTFKFKMSIKKIVSQQTSNRNDKPQGVIVSASKFG